MLVRPYASKAPDVLDALVAAFTAAAAGLPFTVRDGPWTAAESGGSLGQDLAVGWSGFYPGYQYPTRSLSEEMGQPAYTMVNTQSGWGPSQTEDIDVDCASMAYSGTSITPGAWSALRKTAAGNIAAASAAIADPGSAGQQYLNGLVESLTVSAQGGCHQVAQRRGMLVIVTFTLHCVTTSQQ